MRIGDGGWADHDSLPITHSLNMDPSPNPDGKRLVYISVTAGKEQLFIMDPDGSHAVQVTHDDANHEDPAWSPDGKKIAYVQITKDEERIYVMNPDGSGAQSRIAGLGASDSPRLVERQQTRDLLHRR